MKPTVETKICELVKLGHELAKELHCAESAALVSDLATQLDVQFARSNALAAKLSMINGLMDAAEQANKLAQEATEKLVQERDALAAENAALKEACGGDGSYRDCPACTHSEYIEAPETPSTEAFLAEVRAQGVEMLNTQFKKCTGMLYADSVVSTAEHFAAQLRKGGAE